MKGQRFLVLDGLRGIAAFAVLWGHAGYGFGSSFYPHHAHLAVDFFFCLSGFVVAHAYAARIAAGLGFWGFAKRRLIRLYPMIFAGALLGALAFDPGWQDSLPQLVWLDAAIFCVLPIGLAFHTVPFLVDGPVWSLFFEFAANIFYWCAARRPVGGALAMLLFIAVAAILLGLAARDAGGLANIGASPGLVFVSGFPRIAVSFTLGVLIFRYRLHQYLPHLPDIFVAVALAALLAMPPCPWWYELGCVLIGFPLLLCLGAEARETPKLHKFWYWCGALSYPVYVIHQPVLRAVYRLHGNGIEGAALVLVLAWLLLRWYDEPLRRRLTQGRAPVPDGSDAPAASWVQPE